MQRFLLDTNIISELVRPEPNENLISWLSAQDDRTLYLSVITMAEIMRGIAKLDDGKKKNKLYNWVKNEIPKKFEGRIFDFDQESAFVWGTLQGEGDRSGCPKPVMDVQIAAIAVRYGLILVTRNVKDFSLFDVEIFNPFESV